MNGLHMIKKLNAAEATRLATLPKPAIGWDAVITNAETTPTTPTHAYLVIADGALDQVCETAEDARREANDLRMLGCDIVIRKCPWTEQDNVIDLLT